MAEKKFKWIFPENADSLLPDPDLILAFPSTVIKQNPVRSVCKATNPENGEVFYIKYDTPRSFLKKCCNLFYSKSRQEFHAAGLLRKLNLPVIRYEAAFKDAVLGARSLACMGGCVLLSPACASFDAFRNFAERGETFRAIVNSLEN